jgi:hypothetical protein
VNGTLLLGCEGLSKLVRHSLELTEWLAAAEVSRVNIIPPTEAIARHASKLLAAAGLHGHKYALDAIVAATAPASPAPVTVLTSDPEDLLMLCGPGTRVIKV